MSYCRWSTDDYQCDLYVYASCNGGYVTHVATHRYAFKEALPEKVPMHEDYVEAFCVRHAKLAEMISQADRVPIGLPLDGKTLHDDTLLDLLSTLEHLHRVGYRFPQAVILAIQDEVSEEGESPT